MRTLFKILLLVVTFLTLTNSNAQNETNKDNYFQISPRVGYDFPTYNNNTPYIDYKGGLEVGLSLDYYWKWFGIGADFDYINNKPESTYPTTNLMGHLGPITNFNLNEAKITRIFYGIGPSFKHQNQKGNFVSELNIRAGLASIKGGRTLLTDATTNDLLNFHAGYNAKNVLSGKAQVRFTYFLNKTIGIHAGAYYLRHFNVTEELDSGLGISAGYHPSTTIDGQNMLDQSGPIVRDEPCDCDISSIGVFAGITIKLDKKEKVCSVCGLDHYPRCCATCGCGVTVTAKDKFTGEILPNTDVVLSDLNGNIVQSGTTNSYGVVVFNEVEENNYIIKGKLYNIALEDSSITKEEFKNCKKDSGGIQKVILYADENFILKGNVVECNTTEGIEGVDIMLKDKVKASQKNTLSNDDGNFIFHLKQASTFALNGKKDGYYSNEVEISTNSLNRNTTLFIDFEMCVDPCGKAIKLENINFDLDKSEILPTAIPDLERVVQLMLDNPNIQVEMSSHTDSQGSDEYNKQLSQRRADATVNYIVNQGISRNRLIARGAGESELKNTKCANNVPCTDEEHRVNRRTEFKVVCF